MIIPKKIHYCWFGRKPLPEDAVRCINSWKKYCPDYEIIEWNEDNFDCSRINYTQDALSEKKYAFVSDYARFYILYHYGGVYLDTDVEIIKPINHIIEKGNFLGCENYAKEGSRYYVLRVNPGLGMGMAKNNSFCNEMLTIYDHLSFYNDDGSLNLKTIVDYTTEELVKRGLRNVDEIQMVGDVYIYPKDYFCPIDHVNDLKITDNTVSIHHFAGSWLPKRKRVKTLVIKLLGSFLWNIVLKIRRVR